MEAILTGEPIAGRAGLPLRPRQPAVRAGPGASTTAIALAEQICANAPLAVRESRKIVLAADYADDETLLEDDRRRHGRR